MKKILYLMNVDWNWIKQRPHFIAEGLSEHYEVIVRYKYRYIRKGFQHREIGNDGNLSVKPIFTIPKIDRIQIFRAINTHIRKSVVRMTANKIKPDIIYLTSPYQVELLPENYSGVIIYDCMDAHSLFIPSISERLKLEECEAKLCKESDGIIVSSEYLKNYLTTTYMLPSDAAISVIRNAFDGKILPINIRDNINKKSKHKLVYFGTISEWFDFQILENNVEDVEYVLYGPLHGDFEKNKNLNVKFGGTIEHSKLYETVKNADALIMPFIVDEKIKAVDPVKLYEYINFGKCIISVRYPEIERFDPYVYFYESKEEFIEILCELKQNGFKPKYSDEERREFLLNNDWKSRTVCVEKFLESFIKNSD